MVFLKDLTKFIWDKKYRYRFDGKIVDETIGDTWRRVAKTAALTEKDPTLWEKRFYSILKDFQFLPAGRILANAGTKRANATLFNCYVMDRIPDSIDGIFDIVKEAAITQKEGGGVGFDFSTIRPRGAPIHGSDSQASGPVSFMYILDSACKTILSSGHRRGAQMAVLRCDHPDIEEFIVAKLKSGVLTMFNLSVAVTDEFIQAVKCNADWHLCFKDKIYRTIKARELWEKIIHSAYGCGDPGVIFIDRMNRMNNLNYCETISATNPCGEQPLPSSGACLLGSINLTRFVKDPFSNNRNVDFQRISSVVSVAVRFLDNLIDLNHYPLDKQKQEAISKRRIGIGITALADLFLFSKIRYGSSKSIELGERIMETIAHSAYKTSSDLAAEKGAFPKYNVQNFLKSRFILSLPEEIRKRIKKQGIRNSHLISIAPTGTISLLAGNVSSGIEPVFAFRHTRRIRQNNLSLPLEFEVLDYAYKKYKERHASGSYTPRLPDYFVAACDISPQEHIQMQAALQKYVDSSISKTINIPENYPYNRFKKLFMYAYDKGSKGCTTFRATRSSPCVLGPLKPVVGIPHQN